MKRLLTIALLFFAGSTWSQQDAMYTHYAFNTLSINPGYAGSRDVLTITGLHRSQWISFPGAPVTQTITAHCPVINKSLGAGISLMSDRIGPSRNSGMALDFSYNLDMEEYGNLAFGLKAGLNTRSDNIAGLTTIETDDPSFEQNIQSQFLPNFGFGLYYSQSLFYAGFSIPRLLENDLDVNPVVGATGQASESRHYYFIAGSMLNLKPDGSLRLKPTTFIKITAGAPVEMDLTALIYYHDLIWAGPMFRTGDAFGALAGVNISDQFAIGYSFDWSFGNNTGRYNGGSHELMLRYDFIFNEKPRVKSSRYF